MTIDAEVLTEMYSILKQYIPTKDRQEAADNLVSSLVDMLSDHDLKDFAGSDPQLLRALKEYAYDEETEEEFDDE
jgi:hypothetical protein